jgi:GTP-binding protein EngB required for normal cell division
MYISKKSNSEHQKLINEESNLEINFNSNCYKFSSKKEKGFNSLKSKIDFSLNL